MEQRQTVRHSRKEVLEAVKRESTLLHTESGGACQFDNKEFLNLLIGAAQTNRHIIGPFTRQKYKQMHFAVVSLIIY